MSRKTKMVLALAGCLVVLAAFAMLMIQTIDQKILSEAEIKKMIAKDYNGNITQIDLINHKQDYTLTLENANGIYQIIASSASGQMKEIRQIKSYQKPNEKNAELQAEEAAVKKVSGTVIQKKKSPIVISLQFNQKKNYIKSMLTSKRLKCLKQKRKTRPLKKRK
nr:peptidase [Bacillus pumilus]MDH3151050.1 peptidase [Bacillus pumilus]